MNASYRKDGVKYQKFGPKEVPFQGLTASVNMEEGLCWDRDGERGRGGDSLAALRTGKIYAQSP